MNSCPFWKRRPLKLISPLTSNSLDGLAELIPTLPESVVLITVPPIPTFSLTVVVIPET